MRILHLPFAVNAILNLSNVCETLFLHLHTTLLVSFEFIYGNELTCVFT